MKKAFENLLIEHCSPTLAGLKTANLFCYEATKEQVQKDIEFWNQKLQTFGVKATIVKRCNHKNNYLIYVFREKRLMEDMREAGVIDYLASAGYSEPLQMERLLSQLSIRLADCTEFPHEIGLFLGYPLQDVVGFIRHQGKNFCCSGFWKVYHNPEQAQKRFSQFKKCMDVYRKMYQKGVTVTKLTVAA